MKRIRNMTLLIGIVVVLSAVFVSPATAAQNLVTVPVVGTTSTGGTFIGEYALRGFDVRNGDLVAVANLTGTVYDAEGAVVGTVSQRAFVPTQADGSCQILHLELGPLDLDLLGLVVHLDRVVLDITAEQGPGNLLGNLLCAVAGLLDNGGPLTNVASLLNQILAVLTR